MKFLVYLAHATPSVRARYEAAAVAAGVEMDLVLLNRAGRGSSVYRRLADELRQDGRVLPGLLRRYPPPRTYAAYDGGIVLASFSAGYGLSTSVLASRQDAAQVAGVVSIDSWHAGLDSDGTASDADLAPLIAYAIRAREEPLVCWLGFADVPTPQRGPGAFASTAQVAEEVRRLTGGELGGYRSLTHDLSQNAATEHSLALLQWGPGWLAKALQDLAIRRTEAGVHPGYAAVPLDDTIPSMPLGVRALQIARAEQRAGVAELPGGKHSPRIQQYFTGCVRNGQLVVGRYLPDETPWCAAGLGWCLQEAAVAGEALPHKRRLSVREIAQDGVALGTFRSAAAIRRGEYLPQVGDAWLMVRGGYAAGPEHNPFGPSQGRGHVGRVTEVNGDLVETLDANINNTWTDVSRSVGDAELVGAVAHPRPDESESWSPSAEDVAVLRHFWELSDRAAAGEDGMSALGAR